MVRFKSISVEERTDFDLDRNDQITFVSVKATTCLKYQTFHCNVSKVTTSNKRWRPILELTVWTFLLYSTSRKRPLITSLHGCKLVNCHITHTTQSQKKNISFFIEHALHALIFMTTFFRLHVIVLVENILLGEGQIKLQKLLRETKALSQTYLEAHVYSFLFKQ